MWPKWQKFLRFFTSWRRLKKCWVVFGHVTKQKKECIKLVCVNLQFHTNVLLTARRYWVFSNFDFFFHFWDKTQPVLSHGLIDEPESAASEWEHVELVWNNNTLGTFEIFVLKTADFFPQTVKASVTSTFHFSGGWRRSHRIAFLSISVFLDLVPIS